jgi:4-hydroxy-tetrahydrodipicolinate reductase
VIRVGVIGAMGHVGRQVCAAVADDPELALVAAIDRSHVGEPIGRIVGHPQIDVRVSDQLDTLLQAETEVGVDFTHPDAVLQTVRWCVEHAMHLVVGTTGLSADNLEEVAVELERGQGESNVLVAPNFALGAVLMERFAAMAARVFPAVEIVELHHDGKADAPSGTALATARTIAEQRQGAGGGSSAETVPGVRGGEVDGVRIHSVRLPGLVAHQEVIFGGPGQTLTIRHDVMDRSSFMPGVLLAVKAVATTPGLTVGLDGLLDLPGDP